MILGVCRLDVEPSVEVGRQVDDDATGAGIHGDVTSGPVSVDHADLHFARASRGGHIVRDATESDVAAAGRERRSAANGADHYLAAAGAEAAAVGQFLDANVATSPRVGYAAAGDG